MASEEIYRQYKEEAISYKEEKDSSDSNDPWVWMPEGIMTIRLYDEIIEENGRRRGIYMRNLFAYKYFGKGLFCIVDAQEDDPLGEFYSKLKEANVPTAYKYAWKEEGIIKAMIHDWKPAKEDARNAVTVGEPKYLVLNKKAVYTFQNWVSELDVEDLKAIFTDENYLGITLQFVSGAQGGLSIGFSNKKYPLTPIPDNFPTFMNVYCKPKSRPTENQLNLIKENVAKLLADSTNIVDPLSEAEERGSEDLSQSVENEVTEEEIQNILKEDEKSTDLVSGNTEGKVCPNENQGLKFGKYPEGDLTHLCLLCPIEEDCIKETEN